MSLYLTIFWMNISQLRHFFLLNFMDERIMKYFCFGTFHFYAYKFIKSCISWSRQTLSSAKLCRPLGSDCYQEHMDKSHWISYSFGPLIFIYLFVIRLHYCLPNATEWFLNSAFNIDLIINHSLVLTASITPKFNYLQKQANEIQSTLTKETSLSNALSHWRPLHYC